MGKEKDLTLGANRHPWLAPAAPSMSHASPSPWEYMERGECQRGIQDMRASMERMFSFRLKFVCLVFLYLAVYTIEAATNCVPCEKAKGPLAGYDAAYTALERGDMSNAALLFAKTVDNAPESSAFATAAYFAGKCYAQLKHYDNAEKYFNYAVRTARGKMENKDGSTEKAVVFHALRSLAEIRNAQGRASDARSLTDEAQRIPNGVRTIDPYDKFSTDHFGRGMRAMNRRSYQEAIPLLAKAIPAAQDPLMRQQIHAMLAECYFSQTNRALARKYAEESLRYAKEAEARFSPTNRMRTSLSKESLDRVRMAIATRSVDAAVIIAKDKRTTGHQKEAFDILSTTLAQSAAVPNRDRLLLALGEAHYDEAIRLRAIDRTASAAQFSKARAYCEELERDFPKSRYVRAAQKWKRNIELLERAQLARR